MPADAAKIPLWDGTEALSSKEARSFFHRGLDLVVFQLGVETIEIGRLNNRPLSLSNIGKESAQTG
ncbi:hypothetical protein DN745_05655 [Bradymonas sediminis]|uniref:Uncharacterized protein n=1 Tax=Bradymonas sediminis TaxID=1548548 RepID=A0A2Z4FJ35_9DELT|nr:hypothetical protein DN745_05655 [Bradymonas sediminis]